MDPDKVLNEEERKKYTHPKRPRRPGQNPSIALGAISEASTSQIAPSEPQEEESNSESELIIDEVQHEVKVEPLEPLPSSGRNSISSISSRVNEIQNTFMLAYNDIQYNQVQVQQFLKSHQNKEDWSSQKSLILKSIIEQSITWIHKAMKTVTNFFELCTEDQKMLLAKNSVLIYEYFLARYFTSDTGMEQVFWTFGPSDVIKIGNVTPQIEIAKVT